MTVHNNMKDFVSRTFLEKFADSIVIIRLKNGVGTTGRLIGIDDQCIMLEHRNKSLSAFAISEVIDITMVG